MRGRHEAGLVGGQNEINALVQHAVEEALEAFDVAGHDFAVAVDGGLIREEESEHAADVVGRERDAGARGGFGEPPDQCVGRGLEPLVKPGRRQKFERGETGDHGHRIAG